MTGCARRRRAAAALAGPGRVRRAAVARAERRRTRPAAAVLFALVALALACGGGDGGDGGGGAKRAHGASGAGGSGGAGEAVTLRLWQFWDVAVVEPLVREFEAAHPGVRVEVEQLTWKSGLEKIQAALVAGRGPDVCELGSTWVTRFAADGVLAPLDTLYARRADEFILWDCARWNGHVYGLPWVQGSRALFYNRELFRRAGLDPDRPPRTWDELLRAACRIDSLGPSIHGFGQNLGERYVLYKKFMAFAWSNGGRILDDDGRVALADPPVVEALEFYCRLGACSLQEKQEVLDAFFRSGRLGMQISGAWNLRNYREEAPELDYGVALVPRPAVDRGESRSFAGAEVLVVMARSRHPALAAELAAFLQDHDRARRLALAAGSVFPATRDAMSDSAFASDPRVRVFMEQALTSRTPPAHPAWVEMEDVINRAVEEALYGRRAPRWCLEQAAREIETLVARDRGR